MAGNAADDAEELDQRIAAHTGTDVTDLTLDALTMGRDEHLLVIHDRDDREVSFEHGDQLAARWPNARLLTTHQLGHRRILRDDAVLAAAADAVAGDLALAAPASDLVREVDRQLDQADLFALDEPRRREQPTPAAPPEPSEAAQVPPPKMPERTPPTAAFRAAKAALKRSRRGAP